MEILSRPLGNALPENMKELRKMEERQREIREDSARCLEESRPDPTLSRQQRRLSARLERLR